MIEQFLNALEDGTEYDFIANHYWEMTNEELKTILLEYIYDPETVEDELRAYYLD